MFLFILKQPLEDLLQNSCSKSVLNELKHAFESVLLLLKLQTIGQQLYKIEPLHCIFFKDFDNTNSLRLCRATVLKNNPFCRMLSSMAVSVHSSNSNKLCILFSPFELFHAITKSCQINWGIERTKTYGPVFFCKDASWEFCNYRS